MTFHACKKYDDFRKHRVSEAYLFGVLQGPVEPDEVDKLQLAVLEVVPVLDLVPVHSSDAVSLLGHRRKIRLALHMCKVWSAFSRSM